MGISRALIQRERDHFGVLALLKPRTSFLNSSVLLYTSLLKSHTNHQFQLSTYLSTNYSTSMQLVLLRFVLICWNICKVNSLQEASTKCFAVHLLKWTKEYQTLTFQFFTNKSSILIVFVLFFHVVCKILNFDKWTPEHLVQTSYNELTLKGRIIGWDGVLADWRTKARLWPLRRSWLLRASIHRSVILYSYAFDCSTQYVTSLLYIRLLKLIR